MLVNIWACSVCWARIWVGPYTGTEIALRFPTDIWGHAPIRIH